MFVLSRFNFTISKFIDNSPIFPFEWKFFDDSIVNLTLGQQHINQVIWNNFNDNIQNECLYYLFFYSQNTGHVTDCISNRYKTIIFWHNQMKSNRR